MEKLMGRETQKAQGKGGKERITHRQDLGLGLGLGLGLAQRQTTSPSHLGCDRRNQFLRT